jgi:hypothetical protein
MTIVRAAMIITASSVALCGCSASVKAVRQPDGFQAWRIDCSATVASACGEGAERTCPAGFKVLASDYDGMTIRCRPSVDVEQLGPSTADSVVLVPMPPPPPAPPRSGRQGFMMRTGVGWGLARTDESLPSFPNESFAGNGLAFDLALGGAVSPSVAIGGDFAFQRINERVVTYKGQENSTTTEAALGLAGFMVDVFPMQKSGFHFGGTVGPALLAMTDPSIETSVFNAIGAGFGAHAGYDFPLGQSPWSLGCMVRFLGVTTADDGITEITWSVAVLADVMDF